MWPVERCFPYLESMANQAFGMVIGAGGADTIINAMVTVLKARGGRTSAGRARGKGGAGMRRGGQRVSRWPWTAHAATKAVIANVNPRLLFADLVPAASARKAFDDPVARFRPGPGAMMIHLSMDSQPD